MNKGYPDKKTALEIWEGGIRWRKDNKAYGFPSEQEYRFHTMGVAQAAEQIAKNVQDMDSEKAFVLGLLHDYGKRINQTKEQIFHGREGYEQMLKMGYPDVAQICLTHTFPDKDFNEEQFSFPKDWISWCREHLKTTKYTDYDLLIAYCDKFFETMNKVSLEKRIDGIITRYKLGDRQRELLLEQSYRLKKYFDNKTGKDTYKILDIKD